MNRFESCVPILNVKNVSSSIAYYVEKLGFEKEWDWGTPPTFGCVFRDTVRNLSLPECPRCTGHLDIHLRP